MPGTIVSPGGRAAQARGPAAGGVVVGERDDVQPGRGRGGEQVGGAVGAVGHRGVGVQVDAHAAQPAAPGAARPRIGQSPSHGRPGRVRGIGCGVVPPPEVSGAA